MTDRLVGIDAYARLVLHVLDARHALAVSPRGAYFCSACDFPGVVRT